MSNFERAELLLSPGTQVVTKGDIKVGGRLLPAGAVGIVAEVVR